jgi:hypothetical protein
MEIQTAERLITATSSCKAEIAVANLKRYKSPGNEQVLTELLQAGGETLRSEIHKLIDSLWKRGKFSSVVEGVYYYSNLQER